MKKSDLWEARIGFITMAFLAVAIVVFFVMLEKFGQKLRDAHGIQANPQAAHAPRSPEGEGIEVEAREATAEASRPREQLRSEGMQTVPAIGRDSEDDFDPPLDPAIAPIVIALRSEGVETFESCDGGEGHAYPEPTVSFHGDASEGFRAFAIAKQRGLPVKEVRRVWEHIDGELVGPVWQMTFRLVGGAERGASADTGGEF